MNRIYIYLMISLFLGCSTVKNISFSFEKIEIGNLVESPSNCILGSFFYSEPIKVSDLVKCKHIDFISIEELNSKIMKVNSRYNWGRELKPLVGEIRIASTNELNHLKQSRLIEVNEQIVSIEDTSSISICSRVVLVASFLGKTSNISL